MIHCPYCNSEMSDDARFCPRCKSILIAEAEKYQPKPLPRWFHPLTAFIVLALASAGLLATSIIGGSGPKPEKQKPDFVEAEKKPRRTRGKPKAPETETPPRQAKADSKNEDYSLASEYLNKVEEILGQADELGLELNKLGESKDTSKIGAMSEKIRVFQDLTRNMTDLKPPKALQRTHTRIASALRVRNRGYRNLMVYMQQGDLKRLDRGRRDLESADKSMKLALEQIKDQVEMLAPPPPPPPPEEPPAASGEEEPGPGETVIAPEPEEEDSTPETQEVIDEVEPEEGGTEFVEEILPEEGATAPLEEGEEVYPEEGEEIYPEEGEEVYPDEGGEEYPEEGEEIYPEEEEPLPPDLPY